MCQASDFFLLCHKESQTAQTSRFKTFCSRDLWNSSEKEIELDKIHRTPVSCCKPIYEKYFLCEICLLEWMCEFYLFLADISGKKSVEERSGC
jgi:hypothetical protein